MEAKLDKFELKYETLNEKFNEQAERMTDLKHQIDDKADQEDYDKLLKKTLVNTQIFATDIISMLGYIRCVDFENDIHFC